MFAVIKTGGKQYKVTQNDVLIVEKLSAKPGSIIKFDNILMVSNGKETLVGAPYVADAYVEATVLDQKRGEKVIIFKKRRRHTYRRKRGHRQDLTVVRIAQIAGGTLKAEAPVSSEKVAVEKVAKTSVTKEGSSKETPKKASKEKTTSSEQS